MSLPAALVFDLDGTLFDRRQAFSRLLDSLPLVASQRQRLLQLDQNGIGDRTLFFRECGQFLSPQSPDPKKQQSTFVTALLRFVEPDVALQKSLALLSSRSRIAILSNGGSESQRAKIAALGLASFFHPQDIFISAELGLSKPDRRIFDYVAAKLQISPANCIYFGDQQDTDFFAARSAGWQAKLVDNPRHLSSVLNNLVCNQMVL